MLDDVKSVCLVFVTIALMEFIAGLSTKHKNTVKESGHVNK